MIPTKARIPAPITGYNCIVKVEPGELKLILIGHKFHPYH